MALNAVGRAVQSVTWTFFKVSFDSKIFSNYILLLSIIWMAQKWRYLGDCLYETDFKKINIQRMCLNWHNPFETNPVFTFRRTMLTLSIKIKTYLSTNIPMEKSLKNALEHRWNWLDLLVNVSKWNICY